MKKDGKYRFSLQFLDKTEENRMVGELLERMGNRKSTLIVDAVREYLLRNPELREENCKIEISITPVKTPENLEHLVQQMVEEKIALYQTVDSTGYRSVESVEKVPQTETEDNWEEDVSQMLDNLDFFQ